MIFHFLIYTVEAWSSKIKIDGQTVTFISGTANTYEFAYLTRPPVDSNGCYSISVKRISGTRGIVGFGLNDAVSRIDDANESWKSIALVRLGGQAAVGGAGTRVSGMGRDIGMDILTIIYNPSAGTLHGAFNLEPAILLRKDIPAGQNAPLQPFIGSSILGTAITIVNNPRPN